ncbi:MAG: hypothetical protein JWM88_2494 [Verrucomicrobia bacterium]|nr:hypothetical protein [Verrucomicrobiota bacterium]
MSNDDDSSRTTPTALDAAIAAIERSLCADGADARGFDEGERSGYEWRTLQQWCLESHLVLGAEIAPARAGGREHDVTHEATAQRWIKFTKWDGAGYAIDLDETDPIFLPGTPLTYLKRLRLHNALFGDTLELLGIQQEGYKLRIVTSQPDIVGEAPSLEEMEKLLREDYRCQRLQVPPMGFYKSYSYLRDHVAVFDAHPANCVVTAEGVLVPIDFIVQELDEEKRRKLAARLSVSG